MDPSLELVSLPIHVPGHFHFAGKPLPDSGGFSGRRSGSVPLAFPAPASAFPQKTVLVFRNRNLLAMSAMACQKHGALPSVLQPSASTNWVTATPSAETVVGTRVTIIVTT